MVSDIVFKLIWVYYPYRTIASVLLSYFLKSQSNEYSFPLGKQKINIGKKIDIARGNLAGYLYPGYQDVKDISRV